MKPRSRKLLTPVLAHASFAPFFASFAPFSFSFPGGYPPPYFYEVISLHYRSPYSVG